MKMSAGFTLIELMVVILIVAILMGLGVPSFKYVTNSNRMSAEVNGLLGDLQLARAEAMKAGRSVTVCSSGGGNTCINSSDWTKGWIVYVDSNANGVADTGEVLRVQQGLRAGDTLRDKGGAFAAATFNRAGQLSQTGAAFAAAGITLVLRDATANPGFTRCVWIASQGFLTTQTHNSTPGCQ